MRLQTLFLGIVLLFSGCSKTPEEPRPEPTPIHNGGESTPEPLGVDASEGCGPLPDAVIQKKRAQEDENEALKSAKADYAALNELDAYLSNQMSLAVLTEHRCAKSITVESPQLDLCKAVLMAGANSCDAIADTKRGDCRDYRNLLAARQENDPAKCRSMTSPGPKELCKYVVGATFSCPPDLGESFLGGCGWVKVNGETPCEGASRACNTAHFVQAMKLNEPARCELMEGLALQDQCKAFVTGNAELCQSANARRNLCRRALLAPPRLVKVTKGWEGHLYFKNRFDEKASCMGSLQMERGGKLVASLPVTIPELLSGEAVKTVRIPLTGLVGGESFTYEGSCQWFYDKGAMPGDEKDNGVFDE